MNAAWYFGQSQIFQESDLPMAYDMGINYQCPRGFAENFVTAAEEVAHQAQQRLPNNVTVAPQARMHMSLAYFCCLRKNETDWVREIMYDWVNEKRPFDFTVKFDKLECWHERYNSITNILVGDLETQRSVMRLVHDLYQTLEHRGFPMEVLREEQMPIHVTLIGLHYGVGESMAANDNIRPQIPAIHSIVSKISEKYGDSWTGQGRMRIKHDPRYSLSGKWHAGVKPGRI